MDPSFLPEKGRHSQLGASHIDTGYHSSPVDGGRQRDNKGVKGRIGCLGTNMDLTYEARKAVIARAICLSPRVSTSGLYIAAPGSSCQRFLYPPARTVPVPTQPVSSGHPAVFPRLRHIYTLIDRPAHYSTIFALVGCGALHLPYWGFGSGCLVKTTILTRQLLSAN